MPGRTSTVALSRGEFHAHQPQITSGVAWKMALNSNATTQLVKAGLIRGWIFTATGMEGLGLLVRRTRQRGA